MPSRFSRRTPSAFPVSLIEFRNLEFVAHDLPSQSAVDGLLGLNALRHFPPFQRFQHELHSFLVND